jgi:hypothetical protein
MRQSVITTHKQFAVKRMLDEYYQKLYAGE